MAKKTNGIIHISIPRGARMPTEADVKAAKQYILDRSDAADNAQYLAGVRIQETAERLVEIAYKYDIPVSRFSFDSGVNEAMQQEVSAVMDELEEDLMEDVRNAALSCTKDNDRYLALLSVLLTLGHRNMSLQDTLHAYAWRTLRQAESLIAAMKAAKLSRTEAQTKIKTAIQHFNTNPEFLLALKHPLDFAAPYIRNGGKATFPDGSPNVQGVPVNGYDAIKTIFGIAVAQIWMRNQLMDMQAARNVIGYWQDRGSTYPCRMCDDEVGFHELGDIEHDPYPHCGCFCWRMPIYSDGSNGERMSGDSKDSLSNLFETSVTYDGGGEVQIAKGIDKEKSDYQDILSIARDFAKKGPK